MDTLGERIAFYRKARGMSQEKLAETLDISRQAVTKWEHNQSNPSTENLMKLTQCLEITMTELLGEHEELSEQQAVEASEHLSLRWASYCCAASFFCVLGYLVSGIVTHRLSAGVMICMVCIAVFMQLFLHMYFSSSIKSGNFGGIAGFDSRIEYNLVEVKKLLARMDLHLGMISLAYIILLFVSAYAQVEIPILSENTDGMNALSGILIMLYTVEFTVTIFYMNYKAQNLIFIQEADKKRAKAGNLSMIAYMILLFLLVAASFVGAGLGGIKNNSSDALKMVGVILLICLVATIGLFIEQGRIKKNGYRAGTI